MKVYAFLAVLAMTVTARAEAVKPEVAPAPAEAARQQLSHFEPEIGRWDVVNSVMKGPGELATLYFVVETSPAFDGLGIKTDWYVAESGKFFGQVIRTYNPATAKIDQHYFAAGSSTWSATSQDVKFDETGYGASFSGADRFGSFDARTKTTLLPDGAGYDWTIERRYEGGDWFVIDRGEARPASPKP